MDCVTANKQITETFNQVSTFSLQKKREQEGMVVNKFLDEILRLQAHIKEDCEFLENLVIRFEKISWIKMDSNEISKEETLNIINAIILITKDVHSLVLRKYVLLNKNFNKFASKEIKRLKIALDDIKEAYIDLEDICINLPSDNDFLLANEELQNL